MIDLNDTSIVSRLNVIIFMHNWTSAAIENDSVVTENCGDNSPWMIFNKTFAFWTGSGFSCGISLSGKLSAKSLKIIEKVTWPICKTFLRRSLKNFVPLIEASEDMLEIIS